MKSKFVAQKLFLAIGTACLSLALFACPVASLTVNAYSDPATKSTIQPRADNIQYRYKIEDGKMYKRLYNYSLGVWIGDWIYVCDYPG